MSRATATCLINCLMDIRDHKTGNGYDLDELEVKLLADEIERLRGMLEANDINPDCEYISKSGLRVNAPSSGVAHDF